MLLSKLIGKKSLDKIHCSCDVCGRVFLRTLKQIRLARRKRGNTDVCWSCSAKMAVKPQNTKGYWTKERRKSHGKSVRRSSAYYEALKTRNTVNGMKGKKHSVKTKRLMSASRRGKFGIRATAWKGGRTSLNVRVKGYCHKTLGWYRRVFERDGFACVWCGGRQKKGNKIDAHHIEPISKIIKRLLAGRTFCNDDERLAWLISCPEIVDADLKNGITLCRKCHKKEHKRWGSHYAAVKGRA